jgi:putative FmdB family regulatory protein
MAVYDYECVDCGLVLRDHIKGVHEPHPACPDCRGPLANLFGMPANLGFWKAQAQRVWDEIDPGNVKQRCYGTRRVVVPKTYGEA